MTPEENAEEFLKDSVKDFKIFIDTNSLLHKHEDRVNKFWVHITPFLQLEGKAVFVPQRVCEELKNFADDLSRCQRKGDPDLSRRAKNALKHITTLQKAKLVQIRGEKSDSFADNVFLTVFTKFRLQHNLMLITNDKALAQEIDALGRSEAVKTKKRIKVVQINQYGYLSPFRLDDKKPQMSKIAAPSHPVPKVSRIPADECFALATSVRKVDGKMPVSSVPKEGDSLTAERSGERKTVRLVNALSSGGEGTVYTTSIPGLVAKIYKNDKLDRAKFEKLKLMLTKSIDCEGVCFPLALLYNQRNEFVGYLMKQARGKELGKSVFIPQLLKKNFPTWNKVDTVTLCVTILKKLQYLHERNVILGDINPNNILVVSPKEVYFVDTDSYQVGGFPCPVGTINYTAPEIQRKEYSSFLRTPGNEYFAVATLLFMIMLPGKVPYAQQGGENQIDNIIKGDFPYPSGERTNKKTPAGPWRFCWSHLPRFLKDDFYETFYKDEKHHSEKKRYSTKDWLQKFEHYLELLQSGKMVSHDDMSMELFPTRFKKNPHASYVRCQICRKEVQEEWTRLGLCQDCQNEPFQTKACSNCGTSFAITTGEKNYYDQNNLKLPKKCPSCRKPKQQGQGSGSTAYGASHSSVVSSSSSRGSGLCFLTTAACECFGKGDDCYELTMLRHFRDAWLTKQAGGAALIAEYYRIAPPIVEKLNASEWRDKMYQDIWWQYILPCVSLIEQESYEPCRVLYEKMVRDIKTML